MLKYSYILYSYLFLITNKVNFNRGRVGIFEFIIAIIIDLLILFICMCWINHLIDK